jgi:hypothetical protein
MPIDMSLAAKAPPRKTTGRAATPKNTPVQITTLNDRRTEGLIGVSQLAQGLLLMVGQYADAATIGKLFPPLAKEVANIADEHDIVARPVDLLIQVGPYGALIATGLPFVLQIAANHRWIDASRLGAQGVVPPEVLEAQMKTEVARVQAQEMMRQQQMIQEAQRVQKEYEAMVAEFEKVG